MKQGKELNLKIVEGYRQGKSEILGRYVSFSEALSLYLNEQKEEVKK